MTEIDSNRKPVLEDAPEEVVADVEALFREWNLSIGQVASILIDLLAYSAAQGPTRDESTAFYEQEVLPLMRKRFEAELNNTAMGGAPRGNA